MAAVLAGCGGSSSNTSTSGGNTITPPAPTQNVVAVTAGAGPSGFYGANGLFTSVTVCVPGTTSCQTIDNVLVDTGSMGLRLISGVLTLSLPQVTDPSNSAIVECNEFLDGFTWGPIRTADIQIAGEKASAVPIQAIGDPAFPVIPVACQSAGPSEDTVQDLGANGVLGIGPFRQDCGSACTMLNSNNPGFYFTCPTAASCQETAVALTQEAQNPVWLFATDNNGTIVELPTVSSSGQPDTTGGSLVFGIGTQSNNALGSATALALDGFGNFTTSYKGVSYPDSFLDTGSNAYFFLDTPTTGLPACPINSDFYCPSSTTSFTATNIGLNNASTQITFQIGNADTLFGVVQNTVYNNVGGPNSMSFDWGLPFFFGRNVFTAIEGQSTPIGVGPYFAY